MHAHATPADHVVGRPPAVTLPRFGRRGGPLLDFVSANFLYILTTVAVVGVAAGAFLAYERASYSSEMRTIHTAIANYAARARLRTLRADRLDEILPADLEIVAGIVYFGGILGEGLPLRLYAGGAAGTPFDEYGAAENRRLILLAGDPTTPVNQSAGVCEDLAKTIGPGVTTLQIRTAVDPPDYAADVATSGAAYSATAATTDVIITSGDDAWDGDDSTADSLTYTRRARGASPVSLALSTLSQDDRIADACATDFPIAIAYVMGG